MSKAEVITKVEITADNELLLIIQGTGNSSYQHIYREASGVYWDSEKIGFKSTPITEWTYERWYHHIVAVVKSSLGIELVLSDNTEWHGVPEAEVESITNLTS